jgi:DNA-binding PadR family transcriptional regulator
MYIDYLGLTVLALLMEQPRHPYDLQRLVRDRRLDQSFRAGGMPRALYHAVDRLGRRRLVEPAETTREGNRPERTVYRITDEGRDEFQARLLGLLETPVAEHPVLPAALALLAYLTPSTVLDALEARTVSLMGEIAQMDVALRALQEQLGLPRIVLIGRECWRALRRAELEWTRSLVDELRSGSLTWDGESVARHFEAAQSRRSPRGGEQP